MKALLLYEPLFQYLCQLNRLARGGFIPGYADVRGDILKHLADTSGRAYEHKEQKKNSELVDHVQALKSPMNYFVDGLIVQNKQLPLPFRDRWHKERLGFRKDGLTGDELFFVEHLEPALKEPPTRVGAERLLVYYVALGLGFQGVHLHEPDKLRDFMKALHPAVRHWLVEDRVDLLVPQAYDFTDRRNLARPPRLNWRMLLAGLAALILSAVPLYWWLARTVIQRADEQIHLREISESHQGDPWTDRAKK